MFLLTHSLNFIWRQFSVDLYLFQKLAQKSQNTLAALGPPIELPLYNQPWDTEVFHENLKKHEVFKSLLQGHFKRRATEKCKKHTYLSDIYEKEVTSWLKKVDAKTLKKSMKDQSTRQYYEQVFPEIKKSREDKERITRYEGSVTVLHNHIFQQGFTIVPVDQ